MLDTHITKEIKTVFIVKTNNYNNEYYIEQWNRFNHYESWLDASTNGTYVIETDRLRTNHAGRIFKTKENAQTWIDNIDKRAKDKANKEAKEKAEKEARIKAQEDLEQIAINMQLAAFKEFRKATIFIPRKPLNKVLFAVTGNHAFRGWLYDMNNDREILSKISINNMKEVMELLQ